MIDNAMILKLRIVVPIYTIQSWNRDHVLL